MTQRTIHLLKGYARCAQMPADTLIIGLLGFFAVKNPSANPVAVYDAVQRFLKTTRFTDDQGIWLVCGLVDALNDDAGFLRYFEEFMLAHEELLGRGMNRRVGPLSPALEWSDSAQVSA